MKKELTLLFFVVLAFINAMSAQPCGNGCQPNFVGGYAFDWEGWSMAPGDAEGQLNSDLIRVEGYTQDGLLTSTEFGGEYEGGLFQGDSGTSAGLYAGTIGEDTTTLKVQPHYSVIVGIHRTVIEYRAELPENTSCAPVEIQQWFERDCRGARQVKATVQYLDQFGQWVELGAYVSTTIGPKFENITDDFVVYDPPSDLHIRILIEGHGMELASAVRQTSYERCVTAYHVRSIRVFGISCELPATNSWYVSNTCMISPEVFNPYNQYSKGLGVHRFEVMVHTEWAWSPKWTLDYRPADGSYDWRPLVTAETMGCLIDAGSNAEADQCQYFFEQQVDGIYNEPVVRRLVFYDPAWGDSWLHKVEYEGPVELRLMRDCYPLTPYSIVIEHPSHDVCNDVADSCLFWPENRCDGNGGRPGTGLPIIIMGTTVMSTSQHNIHVYSIDGRLVGSFNNQIDLPNGTYILTDENSNSQKVVISGN